MHREPGLRSRATVLYLAPLALLLILGLIFGRTFFGSSSPSDKVAVASAPLAKASATATATPSVTVTPTTAPTTPSATAPAPPVATPLKSLGVVKGNYTLKGPKKGKGSYAVFVLDGKKRVLKTDNKAPFAVTVHTKALPNGVYTATVLVTHKGRTSVATTSTLTVKNKAKATPPPGTTPAPSGTAGAVLALTNTERAKVGCKALTVNAELASAAQAHTADMAKNNYFSHDSQNGKSPFDRMKDAGYSFSAAAENIAMGQPTAADVMNAWMNSAGHKANILNCTYTEIGVGYAKDKNGAPYWTQDFGKPL